MSGKPFELASPQRLRSLARSGLLDSLPEPQFDRVTHLASRLLGVPVSLLSLVDAERQFFKSSRGLPSPWAEARQTPLSHSFCQHVVRADEPLLIEDARQHPLVADNLAIPDLGVIAYLGVPVHDGDGLPLGSLCAIAPEPRRWSEDDLALMRDLAAIVEGELGLRERARAYLELADRNGVLAREYHHRVKNALAVAASLVSLSGREAQTANEAVTRAQSRLLALADAHDTLLADGDNFDLADLIARLLQPYLPPGSAVDASGPEVLLQQRQVTPICLFLHELATNSAKYGAFRDTGRVLLRWAPAGNDTLSLTWDEHAPAIGERQHAGFGSKLIEISVMQLDGEMSDTWSPGHLQVRLAFPVRVPAAEQS
jgi:two-component sensor histidine kinase